MNQNQMPHSRQKTVGTGSAGVNKGSQVNTGSRPVGSGGRVNSTGSAGSGGRGPGMPSGPRRVSRPMSGARVSVGGGRLSLKTILIGVVVLIVIVFLLKSCMGGGMTSDMGGYSDYEDYGSFSTAGSASWQTSAAQTTASKPATTAATTGAKPDTSVSAAARDKRVTPVGNGEDIVTIMVYMCGTDLESKYGMATKDLQEMLNAKVSDKINLIVETGGCKKWKNTVVASDCNQIYKVESGGLKPLETNAGNAAMTDPTNLTNFIQYCADKFPADRNILILWDHGGGSISGYGYDEKNPKFSSIPLAKIDTALENAGCTFDWIGFDACLMATLETGLVCNNHADYLIASEETEPGTGWDYTGWLRALSENTSLSTVDTAKIIIDDFVSASCAAQRNSQVTLSIVDLAELQGTVPEAFREFAASTNEMLKSDNYQQISDARAGVRQFAKENKINQVDLVDLALRIDTDESKALADALQGCVKYNRTTMSHCYGVSIFFPYESTKSVKSAVASYEALGMDDEYTKCIQSFASLEVGGQITASASQNSSAMGSTDMLESLLGAYASSGSSSSPLDALLGGFSGASSASSSASPAAGMSIDPEMIMSLLGGFSGRSMPSEYDWVDTELIADQAGNIARNYLNPANITATYKNGKPVLSLTGDEWKLVQTVELNVFVEDGEGFIDMGLDNTFAFDGNDLLLDFDGTWLTINGNACAYYLVSDTEQDDGSWVTVGRIPAKLNGELVNLQVIFDDANPAGVVTGAYPLYGNGETDVLAKGDIEIVTGDEIQLLCDYYDLDGNYSASYTLGQSFTLPADGLALENLTLDADGINYTYRLTDIYGNHYWLPGMEY